MLLILADLKEYQIWYQITSLWESGAEPLALLSSGHPHGLRYAIMYPVLTLSRFFSVSHDFVFTCLMPFISGSVVLLVMAAVRVVANVERINFAGAFFLSSVMAVAFLAMNGRVAIAFLGYSIIFNASMNFVYAGWPMRRLVAPFVVGLTLCGVSSGTMMSAAFLVFGVVGFSLLNFRFNLRGASTISYCMILVALLYFAFSDILLVLLEKNLSFFGGGYGALLAMLSHGAFRMVDLLGVWSLGSVILLFMCLLFLTFFSSKHRFLRWTALVACSMSAFGLSAFSLSIIPLTTLVCVALLGLSRRVSTGLD